jgi:hypothetical protein
LVSAAAGVFDAAVAVVAAAGAGLTARRVATGACWLPVG